MALIESGITAW